MPTASGKGRAPRVARDGVPRKVVKRTTDDVRRVPAQRRSQDKLQHVLRCATRLVIDDDPQAVSTTMIAAASGVSVGWIYRYFPDKEAIFDQILVDALNRLDARLDEVNFRIDVEDWRQAVAQGIDTIVAFVADDAAFRKLWFSSMLTAHMVAANRAHDTNLAKQLAKQLPPHVEESPHRDPVDIGEMFFGIIDKGIDLAFQGGDPHGDPRIVEEIKIAAVRYLESYLE
jgi:AcrR family transcriptional regulator